jgi:uncharacterized protein YodC (DUF2158 family)
VKAETYKIGEIVNLRSGGPDMTVAETYTNGDILATWFDPESFSFGQVRMPGAIMRHKSSAEPEEPIRDKIAKLTRRDS